MSDENTKDEALAPATVETTRVTAPATPVESASPRANVNVLVQGSAQHGFLLRALWYVFVGWWLSGLVSLVAYLFILTVIGIPVGFWLINRLPAALTLRQRTRDVVGHVDADGNVVLAQRHIEQHPFLLRALWFLVVGWWLLLLWMSAAWAISVTIIGLPLGIWMYNRTPWIATLQKN